MGEEERVEAIRVKLVTALKAEDATLAKLRERFLSTLAFLEVPIVQFHRGQREAMIAVLKLIDGKSEGELLVL